MYFSNTKLPSNDAFQNMAGRLLSIVEVAVLQSMQRIGRQMPHVITRWGGAFVAEFYISIWLACYSTSMQGK